MVRTVTYSEWVEEATRLFGPNRLKWKFVCPSCGHVATVEDWRDAGAPTGAVAFSCIGRYVGDQKATSEAAFKGAGGPCNYAGGGLLALNPVSVAMPEGKVINAFEFADVAQEAG